MCVLIREYSREWAEPAERPQGGTESDMAEDGQRGWRGRWGMGLNREAGSRLCLAWEALTKPAILEPLK